ncbi:MAG: S8 family serine peptidase [Planctomycetes bacterium]|nr:S8 family serine peptidase [Planctomycetota bacterium]
MHSRLFTSFTAALLVLAASCGGGGGGSSASPSSQVPSAPANVAATLHGQDVVLTWSASQGAASYQLFGSDQPGITGTPAESVGAVQASPATIHGIPVGSRVYFALRAKNGAGVSELSDEVAIDVVPQVGLDPLFAEQWHLDNTGQHGGTTGEDADVLPAWNAGATGKHVRIAVVDDGLELAHADLTANVVPAKSINYADGSNDPTGGAHGTSCAGVAAAVADNQLGGKGVAFDAELVGYNVLANLTTANEVDAMTRNAPEIAISTNSWGPADGLGIPQPAPATWQQAVVAGLDTGRGGKGTVYLWAAGNGSSVQGMLADDSNLDGRASFFGVIAVGAVGDDGKKASYSENGANLLVVSPSMGRANHAITTVDRSGAAGYNDGKKPSDYADADFTNTFNGTSSATPLVAGVVALMLEANPDLGWRDVRSVLAHSARRNDPFDADWTQNGAGLFVNHKYGFGVVDAGAAVQLASQWTNLGPLLVVSTQASQPGLAIPDNDAFGVSDSLDVAGSGIQAIEFVRVFFDADDHTYSPDLQVVLTSPSGTASVLADHHLAPHGPQAYDDLVFGTTRLLDEPADGTWTLTVRDLEGGDVGTFQTWGLSILGH